MEEEEGGGMRLSKRFSEKGEVDYKIKAGTAWSHSYLNQKPWHPLSYPNQRRKWIAEQTDAQRQRRAQEIAREFAQEQDFFRQTAAISKREKEKVETMKAVSFMYVRPPGYNAESAKAAEIADEIKKLDQINVHQDPQHDLRPALAKTMPSKDSLGEGKKKPRPKDVFGRALPTEEEFEVLKNAPRLETGAPVRIKPFGVEVRNVKCVRCGNYGHQSGDRECPLKDAIMPNEESRLKRDDPLTAIMAHTDSNEPLNWELKQKPGGMSPPRGGFKPEDPNQQIIPEDIFDEYGGFLNADDIPDLLTNLSVKKSRKYSRRKHRHKKSLTNGGDLKARHRRPSSSPSGSDNIEKERSSRKKRRKKHEKRRCHHSNSITSESSDSDRYRKRRKQLRRRPEHSTSGSD